MPAEKFSWFASLMGGIVPWGVSAMAAANGPSGRYVQSGGYDGPDRRNSGNGYGGDRVTVWARAIAVVGIPGAIALVLVWIGANEIPKITARTEATYQQTLANRDLIRELTAKQDEQLRLMRWICAGVQKTDADRRQCFEK